MKRLVPAALLVACLVAATAAYATRPVHPAHASAGTAVDLRATKIGRVLVSARGRTLYLFEKDRRGHSACSGACAGVWPPLIAAGKVTAGRGVEARLLTTFRRSDGRRQVSYNGHPLYMYLGDSRAGQTAGEGLKQFGAEWYALNARGAKVDHGS